MSVVTAPTMVRPEPRRNQWGQYLIPDPKTGKEKGWVRATTWADSIADNFALEKWKVRMTAVGLVQREDLFASVAAVAHPNSDDGKKKINQLCEDAQEFAGSRNRANLGTALHSFTQQLDMGELPSVPKPWDADIEAYAACRAQWGIHVSPNYVERIVTIPSLGVAGTMDRLGTWRNTRLIIDVKTGADLSYSWTEIAIQLALYAHAETVWDVDQNRHFAMPKVDKEKAIVLHLPAGKATCTPYLVNIYEGWRTALLCGLIRDWRKRKDLAETLESVLATTGATA